MGKTFYRISKLIIKIVGRNNIKALSMTKNLTEQKNLINKLMFKLRLNLAFYFLETQIFLNPFFIKEIFLKK